MRWYDRLKKNAVRNAEKNQMYLCPEPEQLENLIEGLAVNKERYGYPSCPCRISSGILENTLGSFLSLRSSIPDVQEHGACYCALYVSKNVHNGKKPMEPITERRPHEKQLGSLRLE